MDSPSGSQQSDLHYKNGKKEIYGDCGGKDFRTSSLTGLLAERCFRSVRDSCQESLIPGARFLARLLLRDAIESVSAIARLSRKNTRRYALRSSPYHSGITTVAGLLLLFAPLLVEAQHLPPVVCPDFPRREPAANKVTIDIAEALKPSAVVCVRVQNEGKRTIQLGPGGARLQMREKTGKKPRFRDYETVVKEQQKLFGGEPSGIEREGTFAVGTGMVIAEHETLALILPTNELPVGSGLYRVCLSYTRLGETKVAQRCSPVVPVSSSLPNCPPLPVQPPARRVSVHVAKAIDMPGVVCVRVLNGRAATVVYGGVPFWLQRWNTDHWVQRGLRG